MPGPFPLRVIKGVPRRLFELGYALETLPKLARHGWDYPRRWELIWVPVDRVTQIIILERTYRRQEVTGRISPENWWKETMPIEQHPKIAYCIRHWRDNLSWEEAGAIDTSLDAVREFGQLDNLRTRRQFEDRFARLDRIYGQVRREGRMRSQYEIPGGRPGWEILVHVDADGEPVFGKRGFHRMAMAMCLGVPRVPALLGMTHPDGVAHLHRYRMV